MFTDIYRKLISALLGSLLLLTACKEPVTDDSDYTDLDTLNIADSIFSKNFSLPVDRESLRYIRLETSERSLIGRIDQLAVCQDVIWILDGLNNKVLLFRISGKFIGNISVKNAWLQQFDLYNNEIYVFERTYGRIYKFSSKGSLLKVFSPGFHGAQFAVLYPDAFVYNTLGLKTSDRNSEIYQLAIHRNEGYGLKLPFEKEYTGLKYSFGNQFSRQGGQVNFLTAFSSILYKVDTTGIKALTKFDFGRYNMNDSVYLSRQTYNDYHRTSCVTDLTVCAGLGPVTLYRFAFEGKEGYLLADLKRKKIINGGIGVTAGAESDFNNPIPVCSYQDKLVAVIEPRTILLNAVNKSLQFAKQHDLAKVKATDNSFLLLYTLL